LTARSKSNDVSPWVPFEDRRRARDEKRDAVLRMAVKMFLDDGYHRTSLSDVAARLNITKPALYNYFRSKDDILAECYRMGQGMYDASIAQIDASQGSGLEKVRALIRAYASVTMQDFGMCVARLDDRELPPDTRSEVRVAKRRFENAFRREIARGVDDGSIRPCDPKLATFVITGALNGIGMWYRPEGALSSETIAEEFSTRLTVGLSSSLQGKPERLTASIEVPKRKKRPDKSAKTIKSSPRADAHKPLERTRTRVSGKEPV